MGKQRERATTILNRVPQEGAIIAELGVREGRTSKDLLARNSTIVVHMVDLWDTFDNYDNKVDYRATNDEASNANKEWYLRNYNKVKKLTNYYRGRAIMVKKYTHVAVEDYEDEYFDLVFIDADHSKSGCRRDIELWYPKVKYCGWIGGHDYGHPRFNLHEVVDEIFGARVELDLNTTWYVQK